MEAIGLNQACSAIWLTRIFPFSRFLNEDNKPIRRKRLSSNGKPCTHDKSLAQFKASLGAAISSPRSGTKGGIAPTRQRGLKRKKKDGDSKQKPIGCKYSRIAFYTYAAVQIETGRTQAPLGPQLIAHRNKLKEKGRNMVQRAGNLHGYAAKLLYRELLRSLATTHDDYS